MADDQERTEQPTQRKIDKAREEGNVVQSQEIPTVVVLGTAVATLAVVGSWMSGRMGDLMRASFGGFQTAGDISASTVAAFFWPYIVDTLILLTPVLAATAVFGTASYVAQFGFMMSTKAIAPDLQRLNPMSGFKRLFSFKAVFDTLKGTAKVVLIAIVAYLSIRSDWDAFIGLTGAEPASILAFFATAALRLAVRVVLVMAVLAIIDYVYQRWDFMEKHKMTKQEIKDEFKNTEGDPKVKSRIRRLQVEMAQRRMMAEVPKADVVITNPTHYAVALRYDRGKDAAPVVTAKGKNLVAQRIRALAEDNRVPIVERPPLARELYKSCKLGTSVPVHLYQAVAEVLAYVYGLNRRRAA